jgi:hypothetical protein
LNPGEKIVKSLKNNEKNISSIPDSVLSSI